MLLTETAGVKQAPASRARVLLDEPFGLTRGGATAAANCGETAPPTPPGGDLAKLRIARHTDD
jgi:hypothetical protein